MATSPFEVIQYTMTLDGTVQALPALTETGRVRRFELTAGVANANPIYRGTSILSPPGDIGGYIPASAASVPSPPTVIAEFDDGAVFMQNHYVKGTNGEKLHILAWMYV